MKLEKYLADYLEQEKINFAFADKSYDSITVEIDVDDLQKIIKQGLDAFESTEEVEIMIMPTDINIDCYYWGDK